MLREPDSSHRFRLCQLRCSWCADLWMVKSCVINGKVRQRVLHRLCVFLLHLFASATNSVRQTWREQITPIFLARIVTSARLLTLGGGWWRLRRGRSRGRPRGRRGQGHTAWGREFGQRPGQETAGVTSDAVQLVTQTQHHLDRVEIARVRLWKNRRHVVVSRSSGIMNVWTRIDVSERKW